MTYHPHSEKVSIDGELGKDYRDVKRDGCRGWWVMALVASALFCGLALWTFVVQVIGLWS